MTVVLIVAAVVLIGLWTAGVIRAVERRTGRQIDTVKQAFDARLDVLDHEVYEGLKELDASVQTKPAALRAAFVQRSVDVVSQVDAVVIQYSDARGFVVRAKVGQC